MNTYGPGDYKNIDDKIIHFIQNHLIKWYENNHRQLPWRQTNNPYFIWISEVMLQQTRVDTVIPYFLNFIEKFPAIEILAQADEEDVLKAWEGLGYYSRARNIHRGAKMILEGFQGIMPNTLEEIKKIPGIGPYTGGAILSIAYGVAVAAVDGNVMRVFSRLFHIRDDIGQQKTRNEMEKLGETIIPKDNPSYFNQALMELGALICTPTSPKCLACPLYQVCSARIFDLQRELPVKVKKQRIKNMEVEVGLVYKDKKMMIMRRPSQGLLANLWALPSTEREEHLEKGKSIELELDEIYGIKVEKGKFLFEKQHIFTHLKWHMKVYEFYIHEEKNIDDPEILWITLDEVSKYPFPTAFLKVIRQIKND